MPRLIIYLLMCTQIDAKRALGNDSFSPGAASTTKDTNQSTRAHAAFIQRMINNTVKADNTSIPKYKININSGNTAYVSTPVDEYQAQSDQASELGDFMLYVFLAQLNIDKLEGSFKEFQTKQNIAEDVSKGHLGGLVDFTVGSLNKLLQHSKEKIQDTYAEKEKSKEEMMLEFVKSDPFIQLRTMHAALHKMHEICDYDTWLGSANLTVQKFFFGMPEETRKELKSATELIKTRYNDFETLMAAFENKFLCPSIQKFRNKAFEDYQKKVDKFEEETDESWYKTLSSRNPDLAHASWAGNFLGQDRPNLDSWEAQVDPCFLTKNGAFCFKDRKGESIIHGVDNWEVNMTSNASMKNQGMKDTLTTELTNLRVWNILYSEQCHKSPTDALKDLQQKCNDEQTPDINEQAYKPLKCVVDFHVQEFVDNAVKNLLWFIDLFDVEKLSLQILKVFHAESAEMVSAALTLSSLIKKGAKVAKGTYDPRACVQFLVKVLQFGMKITWSAQTPDVCIQMGALLKPPPVKEDGPADARSHARAVMKKLGPIVLDDPGVN